MLKVGMKGLITKGNVSAKSTKLEAEILVEYEGSFIGSIKENDKSYIMRWSPEGTYMSPEGKLWPNDAWCLVLPVYYVNVYQNDPGKIVWFGDAYSTAAEADQRTRKDCVATRIARLKITPGQFDE